jgi:hypothetical protein
MLILNIILWTVATDHHRVSFSFKYLMYSNAENVEVPQLD